ncbi:PepSY domain-containing protein [Arenicella xantha]|uniref:PepSY domain-containing protein n=1 Tax=Arenicella xantha TaxID=644221 RepID=A0A395JKA1_9GAMM|nr:hypothetical protein [Arenicella xantha]RBP50845.1 hypothetical protein DFR28_102261 [Arenicella xantha]
MIRTFFILAAGLSIALMSGAPVNAQSRFDAFPSASRYIAQSNGIRSRSEVVQEVKDRYNAKVLRIQLNKDRSVYKVRVLMPNGKVRDLSIRASR